MPYKIYTYEDPYRLDQADFWEEICALPHFCVSRTLVNGLKDVLGDGIRGMICELDRLIDCEGVYRSWTDSAVLRIRQYSALTRIFAQMCDQGRIDEGLHRALVQNQNHFLQAMRIFIELGIRAEAIDAAKGNREQQLFASVLGCAEDMPAFCFPETPDREAIEGIIVDLAAQEAEACRGSEREVQRCLRALEQTRQQRLEAVVVHGVHQFTPVQLRLLTDMERMGLTIIFLFNYQKKYPRIYSSWDHIYGCFDAPVHPDAAVPEYRMETMQNPSNALACAMGALCEGRIGGAASGIGAWRQLYGSIELMEFANVTEYARYVSGHFEAAIRRYAQSRGEADGEWSNAAVLRRLDEQVYTANRDVHALLKSYYPEYARSRHFLAYPIGQFFTAIYRLWDCERGEIRFEAAAIRECLSSNVLRTAPGEVLLRTFNRMDVLFEQIDSFDAFEREVAGAYVRNYDRVAAADPSDAAYPLRQLAIYSQEAVDRREMVALIEAIEEINAIAVELFSQDAQGDVIDFGAHFRKLAEFLRKRQIALANAEERALIEALQQRLDQIRPEDSAFSGTFRDLRQGLHYFLRQKEEDETGVDWIVRNFEQIDGDVLLSKGQFERDEDKTYHFACLSDRDMHLSIDELLPWPLTDAFIRVACPIGELRLQLYYTALGERSNFLRYALFYGLCFNRCRLRLSYVRQYGDETTHPYALLSMLGLKPTTGLAGRSCGPARRAPAIAGEPTGEIPYERYQMMDMFLCPYRYLLDYVMEDAPVVRDGFLYRKFYENLLVEAVWRRIEKRPRAEAMQYLDRVIGQESRRYAPYFNFWKPTEIYDLNLRARNYLVHEVIGEGPGGAVRPYAPTHMQMRRLFGTAKFAVDVSEVERRNPYAGFEALAQRRVPLKEYSLHRLPRPDARPGEWPLADALRREAEQYINHTIRRDRAAIPSDWCVYCTHRDVCMEACRAGG